MSRQTSQSIQTTAADDPRDPTPSGRYSQRMADQQPDTRGDHVDERGVLITAAGRERARRQLAALDAKWTPERTEQARREFLARLDAA
jgi:hypothetical protein